MTVSECCLIKLLPYVLFEKRYLYFSTESGQPGEPALCQLYRHTFVPCCDERARVCLFASISPEPRVQPLPNFVCILSVARFFFGGVAIRYILPVFWMTSHVAIMGPVSHVHTVAATPLQRYAQASA